MQEKFTYSPHIYVCTLFGYATDHKVVTVANRLRWGQSFN